MVARRRVLPARSPVTSNPNPDRHSETKIPQLFHFPILVLSLCLSLNDQICCFACLAVPDFDESINARVRRAAGGRPHEAHVCDGCGDEVDALLG